MPAHSRDDQEISQFIDRYWPSKILLSDPVFHRWQMLRPPLANGRDHSWVVVDEHDTIQGYYGANPREFVDAGGRSHLGAELTTIYFTPKIRGGPTVQGLIRTLQSKYAVLVGMNTNSLALPIFRWSGFRHLHAVERMVRVYRNDILERVGTLTPLARNILALQKRSKDADRPDWRVLDRKELQQLTSDYRIPGVAHFSRNFENIAWRLLDHPYYRYECLLVAPNDELRRTVLVFREERHADFAVGHVVDVLPIGTEFPDLAAVCDSLAEARGLGMIDAMFTNPRILDVFWRKNWISTQNDLEVRVPNVFNPIELREPPTGNVTYWSNDGVGPLTNLCALHLSKVDGDWDRPTPTWIAMQDAAVAGSAAKRFDYPRETTT